MLTSADRKGVDSNGCKARMCEISCTKVVGCSGCKSC